MKITLIEILLVINFIFVHNVLQGQVVNEAELTKLNKEILIEHRQANSVDTINLIDIIRGDSPIHLLDINGQ